MRQPSKPKANNRPRISCFDGWAIPLLSRHFHLFTNGELLPLCGKRFSTHECHENGPNILSDGQVKGTIPSQSIIYDYLCPDCRRIKLEQIRYRELMKGKQDAATRE